MRNIRVDAALFFMDIIKKMLVYFVKQSEITNVLIAIKKLSAGAPKGLRLAGF